MRYYRPNDDRKIRELQRRAAGGDLEAKDLLLIEFMRQGLDYGAAVGRAVVNRGPILGWAVSFEAPPGFIRLVPPSPWSEAVEIVSSPWFEREGTSFSPISLESPDGAHEEGLRDLFTPDTGDLVADALNYREQLAGAVMALSFAGAALLHEDGMERQVAWDVLTEGISGGPV